MRLLPHKAAQPHEDAPLIRAAHLGAGVLHENAVRHRVGGSSRHAEAGDEGGDDQAIRRKIRLPVDEA